jgi:hypothetical protein
LPNGSGGWDGGILIKRQVKFGHDSDNKKLLHEFEEIHSYRDSGIKKNSSDTAFT